jgi:hypothetical protein
MIELALCYFTSQRDKEARGWMYLKDVVEISEGSKVFTISTPSRSMTIAGETAAEHVAWLTQLVQLCPRANLIDIKCWYRITILVRL